MVEDKLVSVQKHPESDLFIYNYTPRVQYERLWNDVTIQTRGLILDSSGNIIAKPFNKFFNVEEVDMNNIPKLPFDVYTKMDGSLGILYFIGDKPFMATRGSFTSEQSVRANQMLLNKYAHTINMFDKSKTYLFEIIYPENRICVDYGGAEELVLLAIIDRSTGADCELEDIGFKVVEKHDGINDISVLKSLEKPNSEGFVIRFSNGYRLKVKFEEYVRLHRIVTGVSNVSIWEYLKSGSSLDEIIDRVPDEFYDWVKSTERGLIREYENIEAECKSVFRCLDNRKDTALYFKTQKYPNILFSMLDGKDYSDSIWKLLRPKFSKPFNKNSEEC